MKVWFHTTIKQNPNSYPVSYDTMVESKLFATEKLAIKDAENERLEALELSVKHYRDDLRRRKIRQEAANILDLTGIDTSEIMWKVSNDPPEYREPPQHYIYFLEVEE